MENIIKVDNALKSSIQHGLRLFAATKNTIQIQDDGGRTTITIDRNGVDIHMGLNRARVGIQGLPTDKIVEKVLRAYAGLKEGE